MKFIILTALVLTLFGYVHPQSKRRLALIPQDSYLSKPTNRRFTMRCLILPFDDDLMSGVKWLDTFGRVVESSKPLYTFRHGKYLILQFQDPTYRESGSYTCTGRDEYGILNATVHIEFKDRPQICPNNSYISEDKTRCEICPPNSYTISAGATSIQDCICQPGFSRRPSRGILHCTDINECNENNFGCSNKCVNTPGSAYCSCPKGFQLFSDGKTCVDVDECANELLNYCNQICKNTYGSHECSCFPGYVLVDGRRCEGCRKNSFRSNGKEFCDECPPFSITNGPGKGSITDCKCLSGYSGDPSQNIPCVDIDECAEGILVCSHECLNTPGSARCFCPSGFELDSDGKTCKDTDECLASNGGCEGKCENTVGSFRCICDAGYEITDTYTCTDIDECSSNNGGCSHHCSNFRGGYYCSCENGYKLGKDQRSCIANTCARAPEPPYSSMKCYNKTVLKRSKSDIPLETSDVYDNGTTCYIDCSKGYKLESTYNTIRCQENGQWNRFPPRCIAQRCSALAPPQHGKVHPGSCTRGKKVSTRCFFTCDNGYKLTGVAMLRCTKNRKWIPENYPKPKCERISFAPNISCSEDIIAVLEAGKNITSIIVPGPRTISDTESIHVSPDWINVDTVTKFPAGITEIAFTSISTVDNSSVGSCTVSVNVIDEESPTVVFCPESFTIMKNGTFDSGVQWPEPIFADNVMIRSVTSNFKSGSIRDAGQYLVKYSAVDGENNEEVCEFEVTVEAPECGYPKDPVNGKFECSDWVFGRICLVECDEGFALNQPEQNVLSCDDSGVWEPTTETFYCMKTVLPSNSTCPDGFELKNYEFEPEVCVECPPSAPWSASNQTCTHSTIQK